MYISAMVIITSLYNYVHRCNVAVPTGLGVLFDVHLGDVNIIDGLYYVHRCYVVVP